jgi:hypothetical protein
MRLNVWQRAGVVVSVLWAIGGGFYQRSHDVDFAAKVAFGPCDMNKFTVAKSYLDCGNAAYASVLKDEWMNAASVAFVPILLAWLFVYVAIWTVRWVWAGRRRA